MEFEKSLLLIVLTLTLWSVMALQLDRRGYSQINRYFALLLLGFCVPQAYFYTRHLVPPDGLFFLALASQAVIWLKGPLLLAMVRLLTDQRADHYRLHFVPFVLCLAGLLFWPQWVFEWGLLGLVHALIYVIFSLRCLTQHSQRLSTIYRSYKNSAFYWLLLVILGLLLVILVDAILMGWAYLQRNFLMAAINGTMWAISIYLLAIAFFSLYRPTLFFHQDRLDKFAEPDTTDEIGVRSKSVEGGEAHDKDIGAEPTPAADAKPWRELDESLARTLAEKLAILMSQEQLYREHDLSLGVLAARLGISVHQTSELLNVHIGAAYYDYLNRFRLEHACRMLRDPDCHLRVLDIAFESGFSNKNSFHRCFRETYGVTPAAYRSARADAELQEVI